MSFETKLKNLMKDLGITQSKLSALTGIGRPSICQYLSGKNVPTEARRKEIAVALGMQEDYFEQFDPVGEITQDVCVNVPIPIAAKLMGKSKEWVAQGLQDGVFPWGYAVKLKKWSYFISSVKFTEYTGIPISMKEGRNDGEDAALQLNPNSCIKERLGEKECI